MADDWIKIRIDLPDDPNVYLLSEILSIECPTIVGHLVTFWGWMDRHTPDGKGIQLTDGVINKKIGVEGFAQALRNVGWLAGESMALELPNFERHNLDSAKARALESEAKRLRRSLKDAENKASVITSKSPKNAVGQLSDKLRLKCPTTEQNRTEQNNTTESQKHCALTRPEKLKAVVAEKPVLITKRKRKLEGKKLMAFELFWTAFDYKKDRASAADAWYDLELDDDLFDVIINSARHCAAARPFEIQSGKTPIYPQGWLSGRRWEDEPYQIPNRGVTIDGGATQSQRHTALDHMQDRNWANS